ncbi:MAG TPA: TolC family protein [Flavobacteriales bacterium]|jgi:outer membrane protein TolC|nr:TolC family protein [Flavobacteriales bacterium]|tara:strand:- start:350 stop:1681 length:1332 start_codon:yes stop_codon:yes gene_type:complete
MKKYIILLLFPNLLFAQNGLSLMDAIKIGLQENYEIQISEKNQKINQINNNWANAGALPTINLSAKKEEALSDQTKNPTSFMPYELRSEAINGNANVSWTLFNGFAIRANKAKLQNIEEISNNNATLTIENTIQGIILQYYNCVLQKERFELLQKVVKLAKNRLEYQQTKYDIGVSSRIDLLQIENAMLTDSSNLIMQQLNYTNSVKNLNLTLGKDVDTKWTLTDGIDTEIRLFNYEDLKSSTLANNTNIKNQYYNIQLAKQDILLSKAAFYPMVSVNSGAAYNKSTYDIGELANEMDNTGKSINYFANFSVNYRLFNGGKLYNTLRKVKVQKEVNELQYEKIKREVLLQLSLTNDKYNSRITAFSLNQKAFKIAETNYNLATDKQKRGTINSFMLRDIEIVYINSGINAQQSAYNLMESKIALLKITGGIIQDFNQQFLLKH